MRSIAGQLSRALAAATPYVLPCNPNNPTAARHSRQALVDTASQLQLQGGWLIVDAAFIDPTPEDSVADLAGTALLATLRAADSADLHAALARSGILTGHFAAHGLLRLGLPGQESGWERLRIGLHSIVRSPHQARGGSGDDGP